MFDRLILTACTVGTQIERGMKRDGMTREEVLARLSQQMPVEEKKKYANYVIDTDGPKEATVRQILPVCDELKRLAESQV
jgi:dephospho-CoA kinase